MNGQPTNVTPSRRQVLRTFANGFGMVGLAGLFAAERASAGGPAPLTGAAPGGPLAVRPAMFAARAKRVIFLFMSGGPSHVDLFDPKPKLAEYAGRPLPFGQPKLVRTQTVNCLPSPWRFARHGRSGLAVSELLPHVASCADDLCVVRSMVADNINHNGGACR